MITFNFRGFAVAGLLALQGLMAGPVVAGPTGDSYNAYLTLYARSFQGYTANEAHSAVPTYGLPNPELMSHNALNSSRFNQPNNLQIADTSSTTAGVETLEIRILPVATTGSTATLMANPIRNASYNGTNVGALFQLSNISWDQTGLASVAVQNLRLKIGVAGQCNDVAVVPPVSGGVDLSIQGDGTDTSPLQLSGYIPTSAMQSGSIRASELVILVDIIETAFNNPAGVNEPGVLGIMALGLLLVYRHNRGSKAGQAA